MGALVVQLEVLLGAFQAVVVRIVLLSFTPVQSLLVFETVLLKIGQFLQIIALIAVDVGGHSESGAGSKIILVCDMLLLKLHSKIIVPIRAVGNSAAHGFLREQLRSLLKLRLLMGGTVGRCRMVAECLRSQGRLRATQTVVCSGRSRLMDQSNERFLSLI